MSKIIVICVDGSLSDVELPLTMARLQQIASGTSGISVTIDEERTMLKWLRAVSAGEVEDRPIDDERLEQLLENRNERTRTAEDQTIAAWIIEVWRAIEEARR